MGGKGGGCGQWCLWAALSCVCWLPRPPPCPSPGHPAVRNLQERQILHVASYSVWLAACPLLAGWAQGVG